MDQYVHILMHHHICILYGNSFTFTIFLTSTCTLKISYTNNVTFKFDQPIHSHSNVSPHSQFGNFFTFTIFHTNTLTLQISYTNNVTFKFDGPIRSHSHVSTHSHFAWQLLHIHNFLYQQFHIQISRTNTIPLSSITTFTLKKFIPIHSHLNFLDQYIRAGRFSRNSKANSAWAFLWCISQI